MSREDSVGGEGSMVKRRMVRREMMELRGEQVDVGSRGSEWA